MPKAKSLKVKMGGETVEYLPSQSLPKSIPAGKVLVHNQVIVGIAPHRRQGTRGFRAWWQRSPAGPGLRLCSCGWCPELGPHYMPIKAADADGTKH